MSSKVDVISSDRKILPEKPLVEIPQCTAFFGIISGTRGLFFRSHIGIVCLNSPKFTVESGGIAWDSIFVETKQKVVSEYLPVDLSITAFPKY